MSKGKKLIMFILILLLIISSGCWQKQPDPNGDDQGNNHTPDPVEPVPELPGVLLTIVENQADARPQSGLGQADLVYEILSEGNITRFLALFYWKAPDKIGPIRSVRPSFSEITKAYKSPLVHAGGSTAGLASVRNLGIQNLDEIYNASQAFWRSTDRRMPHNLYTSAELILQESDKKDYTISLPPEVPLGVNEEGALANFLEVTYSRSSRSPYATQFVYENNRYYKKINNEPFTDDDGIPIAADNVIVLVIRTTYESADGNTYSNIHLIGSGQAYFFTQGKVFEGTWNKSSAASHFKYQVDDKPFLYSKGQTWVQIIPLASAVTYSNTADEGQSEPEM